MRIALVVVLLVTTIVAGIELARARMAAATANKPVEVPVIAMKLEEQTVNLADVREPHFLKTIVDLRVAGSDPPETLTQKWESTVLDGTIETISAHSYASLLSVGGKRELKRELKDDLNDRLKNSGWAVREVLFTEFVME